MVLRSSTEDRLRALHQVLEEKLVRREVSLKALEDGKIEEAAKGTVRQRIAIKAGISADHAKRINKFIKDLNLKGVSSQAQGDQLRVSGKKRDDLQARHQGAQGGGLRHPPAVPELQGLTDDRRRSRSGPTVERQGSAPVDLHHASSNSSASARRGDGVDVEEPVEDQELHDPQDGEGRGVGPLDHARSGRSGGGCRRC